MCLRRYQLGAVEFSIQLITLLPRWYFLRNLKHIVSAELSRSHPTSHPVSPSIHHIRETLARFKREVDEHDATRWATHRPRPTKKGGHQRDLTSIRPDMVRRLDVAPHPINPMGSQAHTLPSEGVLDVSGIDTLSRAASRRSLRSSMALPSHPPRRGDDDFGGFPGPQTLLSRLLEKISPKFQRKLERTFTVPRTETLVPRAGGAVIAPEGPVKPVPYLSFSATVRNSTFHGLTQENIEELGGVEYRALTALMWIIPVVRLFFSRPGYGSSALIWQQYYLGLLAICFIVTAPYMSLPKWDENFHPPLQHREINKIW